MSQYILDTDCFSLWQRNHPVVVRKVRENIEEIAASIITAEEVIRGRFNVIRQASQSSQSDKLVSAYDLLWETLDDLKKLEIIRFSHAAYAVFLDLRRQKIRIGTQDLRIASIVLATEGGVLITRNRRDFSQLPGLVFEDWTA